MKILWFPRLQFDIDKLHITTWREMYGELENLGCTVKLAVAGKDKNNVLGRPYIKIFLIKKKYFRILSYWISGYIKFIYSYLTYKPNVVILDVFSFWFSFPFALSPKRKCIFIMDNRTPIYNSSSQQSTLRDKILRIYSNLSFRYCRLFLNGMTVITSHYREQVCKDYKFKHSRIGIWSSGVDPSKFSIEKYRYQEKHNKFEEKFVLMQHGQISLNRGIIETVKALNLVNKKDVILVLIGDMIGPLNEKEELFKVIESLKLDSDVHIMPPVPYNEIPKYLNYCDCGIMAYPNIEYWNNNNPIKLLEYLAMGKVVICTDMWTFRNVAGDEKCIFYIKDNDPESIADAINYCYEHKNMLNEWGKTGVKVVEERYTWNRQAQNLLDFFESFKN